MLDLLKGIRRVGPVTNVNAAGAPNAGTIFTAPIGGVGIKTMRIRRLKIRNNAGPNTWVHIGTGGGAFAFVEGIPPLYSIANTTDDYDEFDLPSVSFGADITTFADAVGGGSFDVQIEVEEQG